MCIWLYLRRNSGRIAAFLWKFGCYMNSKIESLKANIEAGLLSGVLPGSGFSLRGFTDMLQISFEDGDVAGARVRVGEFFRYRPGVVVRYSLNVKMSIGKGLVFTWKNKIKPEGYIEIQDRIVALYTQKL